MTGLSVCTGRGCCRPGSFDGAGRSPRSGRWGRSSVSGCGCGGGVRSRRSAGGTAAAKCGLCRNGCTISIRRSVGPVVIAAGGGRREAMSRAVAGWRWPPPAGRSAAVRCAGSSRPAAARFLTTGPERRWPFLAADFAAAELPCGGCSRVCGGLRREAVRSARRVWDAWRSLLGWRGCACAGSALGGGWSCLVRGRVRFAGLVCGRVGAPVRGWVRGGLQVSPLGMGVCCGETCGC